MELIDRYRGCLFGLAIGDALGAPLEYQERGSFDPIDGMIGGGIFKVRAGEFTDETSMALALAESLIESRGFNPSDQMDRYLKWYHQGHLSSQGWCFDVSVINRKAILSYEATKQPFGGLDDEDANANGSLARIAPIPLTYSSNPTKALDYAGECSRTTHAHRQCIDACRYLSALIVGALHEVPKNVLLKGIYEPVTDYWKHRPLDAAVEAVAKGSYKKKKEADLAPDGNVISCLEAALWAFNKSKSFEEGALLAVNLGFDADATGAVFGQLAGAFYGESQIPVQWRTQIALAHVIRRYSEQLFALAQTM